MADEDDTELGKQVEATGLKPLDAPIIGPTDFVVYAVSNEIHLILQRVRPMISPDLTLSGIAQLAPIGMLSMSPQTAKDLMLLLSDAVKKYEKEYGPLETDFMRKRKAE